MEELAFDPQRAAVVAATILAWLDAGLDWSFYYHVWDQVCYPEDFQPFFSAKGVANMVRHWNEVPHRFGMFGVGEEVRPQYFVYQMLSRLGEERIAARCEAEAIRVLAARSNGRIAALTVNLNRQEPQDRIVTIHCGHLPPGRKMLTVYRIDAERRWSAADLELLPIERREIATSAEYEFQVLCPADTVVMVELDDLGEGA